MQHHLIGMIFLKVVFMAQGKRNRLSAEQRADMWRRWKAGESLHEIGRAFGKGHGSIRFLLTQRGGIVPAVRRRSPRTLTPAEREDISRGIASASPPPTTLAITPTPSGRDGLGEALRTLYGQRRLTPRIADPM